MELTRSRKAFMINMGGNDYGTPLLQNQGSLDWEWALLVFIYINIALIKLKLKKSK